MNESFKAMAATATAVAAIVVPFLLAQSADAGVDPLPETPTVTVTLPAETITLPAVTLPAETVTLPVETITIPGPTLTIPGPTIKIPGPTATVTAPGDTQTITVPVPGPTKTLRIPGPTETVTVRPDNTKPSDKPTATVTETVTASPSAGQTSDGSGTVEQEPTDQTKPDDTQTIETIVRRVAIGLLATLIIAGLGILALFFGYVLGRGDERRQTQGFYRTLLGAARGDRPKE